MNCLLIAATAKEITPFLDHYRETQKRWHVDINIDVLITGIGLVAATYQLTRYLVIKRPDLVIQGGIAGSFDLNIPLGKVVVVKQDTIADEGVIESKTLKTKFDLALAPGNHPPYRKGWLVNPDKGMLKRSKMKAVNAVSVNQVTTSRSMINIYKDKFNPGIESMEGAALHYVCLLENIPFLQVRSVSNYIGQRNKKKWELDLSIRNLNSELIRLLESL